MVHAFQVRGAFETDDELPELAAECDLGERAEAVADRDQAERRARDQRVARLADAGGNRNADEGIGVRRVGFRQQAEREAADARHAFAYGLHHTLTAAADHGEAAVA